MRPVNITILRCKSTVYSSSQQEGVTAREERGERKIGRRKSSEKNSMPDLE